MRASAWGAVVVLLLVAGPARADGLNDPEADRLFKEGQDLLEHGQVHEACDRFDVSLRREQNFNTLALLALCHERDNKPGKAWNEFKRAERDAPPGEKAAVVAQHLKALESKVARARLDVGSRVIGEVRVDNEAVLLDQGRVVTDPGLHTIAVKVEAAGSQGAKVVSRNAQLNAGDNPDIVIDIGDTRATAGPSPQPGDGTPVEGGSNGRRILGFALMGVGVVAAGVGTFFGLDVLNRKNEPSDACYQNSTTRSGPCSSANAAGDADDKRHSLVIESWLGSTVPLVLGAAAFGAGVYFVLTPSGAPAPPPQAGKLRVTPLIGPGSLGLHGTF
jgi:hypothetical protein